MMSQRFKSVNAVTVFAMSSNRSRRRRPRKKSHNKQIILCVTMLAVIVTVVVVYTMWNSNQDNPNGNTQKTKVLLETSMGNITIELRDDMPITTANFINLTQTGIYDGTTFHRVVNLPDNLVIVQGGDPNGNGVSDDSIPNIVDEYSENPENNENKRGTVAMAKTSAPNSASSQFFINGAYNSHLDNNYSVFGDVIDGMDGVDAILSVDTDSDNRPLEDVTLFKASVIK